MAWRDASGFKSMTFVPLISSRSTVLTRSFGLLVALSVTIMWVLVFFKSILKKVERGMVGILSNMTRMCGVEASGVLRGSMPSRAWIERRSCKR